MINTFRYFRENKLEPIIQPPFTPGIRWIDTDSIFLPFPYNTSVTAFEWSTTPAIIDELSNTRLILIKQISLFSDQLNYTLPREREGLPYSLYEDFNSHYIFDLIILEPDTLMLLNEDRLINENR